VASYLRSLKTNTENSLQMNNDCEVAIYMIETWYSIIIKLDSKKRMNGLKDLGEISNKLSDTSICRSWRVYEKLLIGYVEIACSFKSDDETKKFFDNFFSSKYREGANHKCHKNRMYCVESLARIIPVAPKDWTSNFLLKEFKKNMSSNYLFKITSIRGLGQIVRFGSSEEKKAALSLINENLSSKEKVPNVKITAILTIMELCEKPPGGADFKDVKSSISKLTSDGDKDVKEYAQSFKSRFG